MTESFETLSALMQSAVQALTGPVPAGSLRPWSLFPELSPTAFFAPGLLASEPGTVSVTQGTGKVAEVKWQPSGDPNIKTYQVFRNTVNNPNTATQIGEVNALVFHDTNVNYNQTYYYWVRAVDEFNNVSNLVGGVGITIQRVDTQDLNTGAVSQRAEVFTNSLAETTSFTFVDMPGMLINITTAGGDLLIFFSANCNFVSGSGAGQTGAGGEFQMVVDGANVHLAVINFDMGANNKAASLPVALTKAKIGLAAGFHTVKIQWRANTSGGTVQSWDRSLQVIELKR